MITRIPQWMVFDLAFTSDRDYDDPFWEVDLWVEYAAPGGRTVTVEAFWDGGRSWRACFAPDEIGDWTWRTGCSDPANSGLHGRSGRFRCLSYEGDNPLYRYGALRVSGDGHTLVHHDGTPFFWLGDTAWNGVLRAGLEDWARYLRFRHEQGFTAIQFVSTQWRGSPADPRGEAVFSGTDRITLNPVVFQRLDPKVFAINYHGMIAAPVMLWALTESDPGRALSEAACIRLGRYLVARWGACRVVWLLGGDGDYTDALADRWRRIGRGVFGARHDRLVTLHPCGQRWVGDEFRDETWFDLIGYQSGHGDSPDHLRWLVDGPPARNWDRKPPLPVINLEPNYELHPSYHSGRNFTAYEVRRAAYWSLLVAPPGGVPLGHNAIWVWREEAGPAEGHANLVWVPAWHEGLDTPGVQSMLALKAFFEALPWWTLRPAPGLLAAQPGDDAPGHFIAAARTLDDRRAVIYLPVGGAVPLRAGQFQEPATARWVDPRSGAWGEGQPVEWARGMLQAPDDQDWLLVIETKPAPA